MIEGAVMSDWTERVEAERDALIANLARLRAFLPSASSATLSAAMRSLLDEQARLMQLYIDVLVERLRLAGE
jgi:hypothetical protein